VSECSNPRLKQNPDGTWVCPDCNTSWTENFRKAFVLICCVPKSYVPNCVEAHEVHEHLMQDAQDASRIANLWGSVWEPPKRDKTCKTCGKKNDLDATHCWWCTCRFQD
jgi:hypothetical protein